MEPAASKSETKYERLRKIGIGSYGVVFKCVNRQTGQIVAIKRYSENDTDPVIRKIAMREVRMLRQLKHPNLINLIEVFRRKRILHLVFDYCELTVLDVIEKYANNCPLNLVRKIIWQLVNGVSHCHAHNCIHRDIKPENILINQAGVVKLCDFGFARNLSSAPKLLPPKEPRRAGGEGAIKQVNYEREARFLGVTANQLSQYRARMSSENGTERSCQRQRQLVQAQQLSDNKENEHTERQALTEYVATRWYRAPELLVGDIFYDKKIDIWAIGCVAAELMRGEPVWPGKADFDQLRMIRDSLGPLTSYQAHMLRTQALYDQTSIERLLNQTSPSDPLERKLPTRVGAVGTEFVVQCLQMEPSERPTCDQLLRHPYIQSAQMVQFIQEASRTGYVASTGTESIPATARSTTLLTEGREPSLDARALAASEKQHQLGGRDQRQDKQASQAVVALIGRTNSQAILSMANSQPEAPASKRQSVMNTDSEAARTSSRTNPPLYSPLRRQSNSLAPIPVASNTKQSTGASNSASTGSVAEWPPAALGNEHETRRKVAQHSNDTQRQAIRSRIPQRDAVNGLKAANLMILSRGEKLSANNRLESPGRNFKCPSGTWR